MTEEIRPIETLVSVNFKMEKKTNHKNPATVKI